MTAVTQPSGQEAINVKTEHWQAAIPVMGDAAEDEWTILAQAWSQQAQYEHRERLDTMLARYQEEERQLREQFMADLDTKIKQVKATHEARKAQSS